MASDSVGALKGSICILLAMLLFGVNDTIVKLSHLPISQLLFSRYVVQFIIAIIWWHCKQNKEEYGSWYGPKKYFKNIWFRGTAYCFCTIFDYYSIMLLPVGDQSCIYMQAPLLTAFAAFIFLKEELPKMSILIPSVFLISSGVLLVTQPGFLMQYLTNNEYESLNVSGVIAVMSAAACWTIAAILVRKAVNVYFVQLEIAASLQASCIWLPLFTVMNELFVGNELFGRYNEWRFDLSACLITSSIGIIGFGALAFVVKGYQYGDATKVAFFEYMNLPIRFVIQCTIFHDIPNKFEVIGSVMVFIGSILNFVYEVYKMYSGKQEVVKKSEENDTQKPSIVDDGIELVMKRDGDEGSDGNYNETSVANNETIEFEKEDVRSGKIKIDSEDEED